MIGLKMISCTLIGMYRLIPFLLQWIAAHIISQPNTDGFSSHLGLKHVENITHVLLYSSVDTSITSPIIDDLLNACCQASTTFRTLQKKRQIPKPWIDVSFEFYVVFFLLPKAENLISIMQINHD